jgi:hypothetical protein
MKSFKILAVLALIIFAAGCSENLSPTDALGKTDDIIVVTGILAAEMEISPGMFYIPTWQSGLFAPEAIFTQKNTTAEIRPKHIAIDPSGYIVAWEGLSQSLIGGKYTVNLYKK